MKQNSLNDSVFKETLETVSLKLFAEVEMIILGGFNLSL